MKKIFVLVFALMVSVSASAGLVESGIPQVGRWFLKVSDGFETVYRLEILPGKRFRYWDFGAPKMNFFYEGRIENIKQLAKDETRFDLIVERDGRIHRDQVVDRATSEYNLRIRRLTFRVLEQSFTQEVLVEREVSYRGEPFRIQHLGQTAISDGSVRHFEFLGTPIDY